MLNMFKLLLVALCLCVIPQKSLAAATTNNILQINAATTNITTGAFVQLTASTPIVFSKMLVVNSTSSPIIIAFGASGSEIGYATVAASSNILIDLNRLVPLASRISLEAIGTTVSSGFVIVSALQ